MVVVFVRSCSILTVVQYSKNNKIKMGDKKNREGNAESYEAGKRLWDMNMNHSVKRLTVYRRTRAMEKREKKGGVL